MYKASLAQFITYNPSVGLDCANFKPGQAYCVHVQTEPTTLVKPLPQATKKAPGTNYGGSPTCDMWQKIFPGDEVNKKETCSHLTKIWGIDDATLKKYNSGLAEDCANIEVNSYLCVRTP
ncbi:carbohydrate-binding module family 50 protein [Venturia nashicola]|uniref:Carbohydrate-binding module family 50 protein n=1 Tax=Venturia nashicola TaxID=86259 RepID=A0A4Z1PDC7_9PEZI|nr:carbohydrate-binding module family 50 protein [Venturia nashicola]